MTKTVYAPDRTFLILTDIKVGLWTTKHFASDTQHVRCFLVKAVLIRHQQVHKVWSFCCFRWFASLPQRTLKCNILKTFLIFNTTGSHFCTLNLLQFLVFFLKWGHYIVEKHARFVCFPQTGHLAVRKGKLLAQASAEMHWLALCWLVDLKHSQQKPDCNYSCSCSLCIHQVQQGSWDVLFSIKTQQSWRVPLTHSLVGKETHLTWLSCLPAKSNIARLMIGA